MLNLHTNIYRKIAGNDITQLWFGEISFLEKRYFGFDQCNLIAPNDMYMHSGVMFMFDFLLS